MELLDRLAPTPEAHPSLAWFVRPADDDVAIGRYVRAPAFRDAFRLVSPGRLAVMSDCLPSTLTALVTLQILTRRGTAVPLSAVFPEQASDVAGIVVERVAADETLPQREVRRLTRQMRARVGWRAPQTTIRPPRQKRAAPDNSCLRLALC